MSDGLEEVRRLATNLGRIAGDAVKDVDEVLKKGAQNIKTEMQADVSGSPHFKGMAGAITYDSHYLPGRARYVIGPDKGRRGGALGNIYYFGTSRGGGSGDIDKPLRSEEPRTVSALEALAARWAGRL
ncbi:hypothetical protein [Arthrobacter sp. StoSoilB13]|uniref:hypothetical protein n=1 Tax=Arthrobacter sp. StoSoilB13 TaxID=2830993 RepID=UPI001CC75BB2|nr:hypothetical protein [Arthrobacter sp. StoSoilB13]BCW47908.1 hypothetical protein StoSoilB13_02500 [Arthrobacter sp. StoSoilB13]